MEMYMNWYNVIMLDMRLFMVIHVKVDLDSRLCQAVMGDVSSGQPSLLLALKINIFPCI